MDYICATWKRVKTWWNPGTATELEPLNPRNKIMDPAPRLKELERELHEAKTQDLDKIIYFYKPKTKLT